VAYFLKCEFLAAVFMCSILESSVMLRHVAW